MMTQEQSQIVKLVYSRFIDSEEEIWSEFDDNLEFVGYLTDKELIQECSIKVFEHSKGDLRCVRKSRPYLLYGAACFRGCRSNSRSSQ